MSVAFSIPLAIIGAMLFLIFRGFDNNIYTQIGLVLLVGLTAKNAILIVEFARTGRQGGKSIRDAAIDAAATRFRPILMTSFAFIMGCVPLMLASGAGANSRQALRYPRWSAGCSEQRFWVFCSFPSSIMWFNGPPSL
ncbi:MAG: hypothetical protein KatS3mg104_1459 [Phycisphaerae bacterium]|nr:MAG: hypothetical protein KatS3mg104_1459 [Phycisphaerae bacterium]